MRHPKFIHGVMVAAVLGFCASVFTAALTPFVALSVVIRILIPALALAYLLYVLSRSDERLGRVTTVGAWSVLAIATWWAAPPLPLYLFIHVGAIWLVRSLYFYSGVIPALMDLGLCAFGVAVAIWAATHSGSVFLAAWCFFLVQALFVAIPASMKGNRRTQDVAGDRGEAFEQARRQADRALRQLFTQ